MQVGEVEPDAQAWHHKTLLEAPAFLQRYWLRRAAPPELMELSRHDLLTLRDVLHRAIREPEAEEQPEHGQPEAGADEAGEPDAEESDAVVTPQARVVGQITAAQRSATLRRELLQFHKGEALSMEEVKAARRVFDLADRDDNGQLSAGELSRVRAQRRRLWRRSAVPDPFLPSRQALQAMNFRVTSSDVKFMLSAADQNLDGGIDFSEFLNLMHTIRTRQSEVEARTRTAADRVGRLLDALDEEDPYEEADLHPEAAGSGTVRPPADPRGPRPAVSRKGLTPPPPPPVCPARRYWSCRCLTCTGAIRPTTRPASTAPPMRRRRALGRGKRRGLTPGARLRKRGRR